MTRKYTKRNEVQNRVSKCGHVSKQGRYFRCENCLPDLESEDLDGWNYFIEKWDDEEISNE